MGKNAVEAEDARAQRKVYPSPHVRRLFFFRCVLLSSIQRYASTDNERQRNSNLELDKSL